MNRIRIGAAAVAAVLLLGGCGSQEQPAPDGPHLEQVGEQTFYSGQPFSNGYALVQTKDAFGYVDSDGEYTEAFSLEGGSGLESFVQAFQQGAAFEVSPEGLYPYYDKDTDAWGYRDIQSGETVIDPQYESAMPFREGRAVCVEDGQPTVIDESGTVILTAARIYTGYYQKGLLLVSDGEEAYPSQVSGTEDEVDTWICRLVDLDGETVLDNLLAGEGEENLYGYADPLYIRLDYPDEEVIAVMGMAEPGAQPGYYTPQGELIRALDGQPAYPVADGVTWYQDSETGLFGLETVEGSSLTEALYSAVSTPSGGLAYCTDESGMGGFLSVETGQPVSEFVYEQAMPFAHGYCVVIRDGLAGLVDDQGQEVIPCQYENLALVDDGLLYLEAEGTVVLTTLDGQEVEDVTGRGVTYASEGIFSLFSLIPQGEEAASRDNQVQFVRFVNE
ncbi:MAG TPA: WG repeat-containing protein [Firmicutes bacterium]|nr:WG repeat-containing protein [Bacillota bacterium]